MFLLPDDWSALTTTLVVGLFTLLTLKCWQSYRFYTTFKRMGIPGPTPRPVFGNGMAFAKVKFFREPFEMWNKQYGKVYGLYLPVPYFIVTDFDLIREITIKKFSSFSDRRDFFNLNKDPALKDTLLNIRGDHWKHVRGQLSPAFSSTKLKQMMPAMQRVAQNLRTCLAQKAAKGEEVELKTLCKNATLDVIAGVAFGLQVDSLQGTSNEFHQIVDRLIKTSFRRSQLFAMFPIFSKLGFKPFPRTEVNYLLSVIEMALKERQLDTKPHGDFLQLLVDSQKASSEQEQVDAEIDFKQQLRTSSGWNRKGLTQREMYSNSFIFLLAGFDSVANGLALTVFSLAANPDCLRKAVEEVDEKIGQNPVTYDAVMNMTYLDMCVNESLRIHFPGFFDRLVTEDVEIGGYHLKKGWVVGVPTAIIHMDPELWPDPTTFDPERFTAEARAARSPLAFMPFGMGPRNCIGMRLAQLEMRMMLATVLQSVTPVLCSKSVYPPSFKPLEDVREGMWVKFEPREK